MSNLVPEKRLDRMGRMITRWVKGDTSSSKKNSILGTVIPTIPSTAESYIRETTASDEARRASLLRTIRVEIQREFENQPEMIGLTGDAKYAQKYRMTERLTKAVKKMEELEASTLKVLLDAPCSKYSLMQFVNLRGDANELQFRERMHYMLVDDYGNCALYNAEFTNKVRDALDVDDLSEYSRGSTEQEAVASALNILHHDWIRRSAKSQSIGKSAPKDKVDTAHVRHLLDYLMEHPERGEDINIFLIERGFSLDEVDPKLLDEYIKAPIPALGDGLL